MAQPAFSGPPAAALLEDLPRLFVALELTSSVADKLQTLVRAANLPSTRWAPRSSWHITLHFIGEARIDKVCAALETVSARPFNTNISGLGTFGRFKPRVLWAGVPRSDELIALHGAVGAALRDAGFPLEDRPYVPHVTLAKFGAIRSNGTSIVNGFLEEHVQFSTDAFHVGGFTLYESVLNAKGPLYVPRRCFSLE